MLPVSIDMFEMSIRELSHLHPGPEGWEKVVYPLCDILAVAIKVVSSYTYPVYGTSEYHRSIMCLMF